jgi:hypothetical protein
MPVTAINVRNSNDFVLTDKYDNIRYTFPPGRVISIPVAVARHIFGWNEQAPHEIDLMYTAERLGWDRKDIWPQARQWLKRFIVRPAGTEPVPHGAGALAFDAVPPRPLEGGREPEPPRRTPKPGALERRRELTRLRVARYRARLKERQAAAAAAEGRCNAYM